MFTTFVHTLRVMHSVYAELQTGLLHKSIICVWFQSNHITWKYPWMSLVLIFIKFVQGCQWWCMTNGLMDTH